MVILIDDDPDDLDLMREAIREHNNSIVPLSFQNPEEAIDVITNDLIIVPNFIFIDINMPRLTGDKILRHLRSMSEFDQVTITMFSTAMSVADKEKYKSEGANFAFQKPVAYRSYKQILKSIFGKS